MLWIRETSGRYKASTLKQQHVVVNATDPTKSRPSLPQDEATKIVNEQVRPHVWC